MKEKLKIETCKTAAESPFSNAMVEHHNSILKNINVYMKGIHEDVKCEADVALTWAVSAKNSFSNVDGFPPNQLVLNFNPMILNDYHPALESGTSFYIVYKNIEALHKAREKFINK